MSSFATALLSGFVKQARSDVSLEQKRRDEDDARLAQLEDLVFGAALDPKKNISKSLTAVLQQAKTDLDNREPIDLLGTPSERLRLNLKDVQQMINDTDENLIQIGNYSFPGSKAYFDAKNTYDQSREYWKSLQNYVAVPENLIAFRTHFQDNASELSALNTDFKRNRKYYLQGYTLKETPKGKDGEMKSLVRTTMDDFNLGSIMDLYSGNKDTSDEAEALEGSYSQYVKGNKLMALSKGAIFFPYKQDGKN